MFFVFFPIVFFVPFLDPQCHSHIFVHCVAISFPSGLVSQSVNVIFFLVYDLQSCSAFFQCDMKGILKDIDLKKQLKPSIKNIMKMPEAKPCFKKKSKPTMSIDVSNMYVILYRNYMKLSYFFRVPFPGKALLSLKWQAHHSFWQILIYNFLCFKKQLMTWIWSSACFVLYQQTNKPTKYTKAYNTSHEAATKWAQEELLPGYRWATDGLGSVFSRKDSHSSSRRPND